MENKLIQFSMADGLWWVYHKRTNGTWTKQRLAKPSEIKKYGK